MTNAAGESSARSEDTPDPAPSAETPPARTAEESAPARSTGVRWDDGPAAPEDDETPPSGFAAPGPGEVVPARTSGTAPDPTPGAAWPNPAFQPGPWQQTTPGWAPPPAPAPDPARRRRVRRIVLGVVLAVVVIALVAAGLFYAPAMFLRGIVRYLEVDPERESRAWGLVFCVGLFFSHAASQIREWLTLFLLMSVVLTERLGWEQCRSICGASRRRRSRCTSACS